ncbi:hypothetical protein ASZ90_014517 [hydrocarbon metagenome]|uniref:Uncharacterized protein n=1 Tax=hydrocarbon metagenome TaxID=938273 RepID=A0A0W8F4J7_9ZZZZ
MRFFFPEPPQPQHGSMNLTAACSCTGTTFTPHRGDPDISRG